MTVISYVTIPSDTSTHTHTFIDMKQSHGENVVIEISMVSYDDKIKMTRRFLPELRRALQDELDTLKTSSGSSIVKSQST